MPTIASSLSSYYEHGGRLYVSNSLLSEKDIQRLVEKGKLKGAGIKTYCFFMALILVGPGLTTRVVVGEKIFHVNKKSLSSYLARERALCEDNKLITAFALDSLYKCKKNDSNSNASDPPVSYDFPIQGIGFPKIIPFEDLKLAEITPDNIKNELELKPYRPAANQIRFKKLKNCLILSIPYEEKTKDAAKIKYQKFYYKISGNAFSPKVPILPSSPLEAFLCMTTVIPMIMRGLAASTIAQQKFNNLHELIGYTLDLSAPKFGNTALEALATSSKALNDGFTIQLKDSSIIIIHRNKQEVLHYSSSSSEYQYYSADDDLSDNNQT